MVYVYIFYVDNKNDIMDRELLIYLMYLRWMFEVGNDI